MKERVLKALANPPRIFYVPYTLALINFVSWFLVFVVCIVIFLIIPPHTIPAILPLFFLGFLSVCHAILAFFSRKDSQIAQIIFATLKILKNRIPRKLVV